jgi:hypothetical protein
MILCVHGYGVGLTVKPFITAKSEQTCGFEVFLPLIEQQKCGVFDWRITKQSSILDSILHLTPLTLYYQEKKLAEQGELQGKLFQAITIQKIDTLVVHSMGCRLVLNMIKTFGLPASVKKIVFVATDVPHKATLGYVPKQVEIISVYCPWDQALPWSWMLNWYIPAGLWGFVDKRVKNTFVPYTKGWDVHHGILKQQELLESVKDLSE